MYSYIVSKAITDLMPSSPSPVQDPAFWFQLSAGEYNGVADKLEKMGFPRVPVGGGGTVALTYDRATGKRYVVVLGSIGLGDGKIRSSGGALSALPDQGASAQFRVSVTGSQGANLGNSAGVTVNSKSGITLTGAVWGVMGSAKITPKFQILPQVAIDKNDLPLKANRDYNAQKSPGEFASVRCRGGILVAQYFSLDSNQQPTILTQEQPLRAPSTGSRSRAR